MRNFYAKYFYLFLLIAVACGGGCRSSRSVESNAKSGGENSNERTEIVSDESAPEIFKLTNDKQTVKPTAAKPKILADGSQYFVARDAYGNVVESRYFETGAVKYISLQTNADGTKIMVLKQRDGSIKRLAPENFPDPWQKSISEIAQAVGISPDYHAPYLDVKIVRTIMPSPIAPVQNYLQEKNEPVMEEQPASGEPTTKTDSESKPDNSQTAADADKNKKSVNIIAPRISIPSFFARKKPKSNLNAED